MNREEAAEFTRKLLARAEINAFPGKPKRINNIPVFYFEAALAALREMAERERGCDTCNKGKAHFGDVLWAINKSGLAVINIEGAQANVQFDCCPMCGKQLSGNPEQVKEGGE